MKVQGIQGESGAGSKKGTAEFGEGRKERA